MGIELERQRHSVLVIASPAVKRCLHAYFTGCELEEMPYLPLDHMAVQELRPTPHGTKVADLELGLVQCDDKDTRCSSHLSSCSTLTTQSGGSHSDLKSLSQ